MSLIFDNRCGGLKLTFLALLISGTVSAQKDVTKFLGIPVDGSKAEMTRSLKGKGFTVSSSNSDVLVGEFNGNRVNVHIVTNNNKVCRIMVTEINGMSEVDIKVNFNKLYQQFMNNKNYMAASASDKTISEDEDVFIEMAGKKKRYEAAFFQKSSPQDSIILAKELESYLIKKYTNEQIVNPTPEIKEAMIDDALTFMKNKYEMKSVWFMISERYGKYYINLFYDNEYNRANGDDL